MSKSTRAAGFAALILAIGFSVPALGKDHGNSGQAGPPQGGSPSGFSHGKANWKTEGGVPPGWSKGHKKGWNCSVGDSDCKPPGLK